VPSGRSRQKRTISDYLTNSAKRPQLGRLLHVGSGLREPDSNELPRTILNSSSAKRPPCAGKPQLHIPDKEWDSIRTHGLIMLLKFGSGTFSP